MKMWTCSKIAALKGKQRFACVTASDAVSGCIADSADIPLILVGDSLGMTVLGFSSTLPVTMEMMLHHTAAVVRGVKNALVVADMPFMSYQTSEADAIRNAGRFLQEAGADAVKIEGGAFRAPLVSALVQNGIPVLGHIGLTPQSVLTMGGFKRQGKTPAAVRQLLKDAKTLQSAGVFAVVVECVPDEVGKLLSESLSVPVIGIGAGSACDAQILVFNDLVGLTGDQKPSFAGCFGNAGQVMRRACEQFRKSVEN